MACNKPNAALERLPVRLLRWRTIDNDMACNTLSCSFSRIPDAKFHPRFVSVATFDAGMRGGGRTLSDG
jgi:hypothetical protein